MRPRKGGVGTGTYTPVLIKVGLSKKGISLYVLPNGHGNRTGLAAGGDAAVKVNKNGERKLRANLETFIVSTRHEHKGINI